MTTYIALLRKDPSSDYSVDFPDFPGCITAGRTLDEARRMAGKALRLHIQGMIQDRDPIPPPSPLDGVLADPQAADAVPFLVDVPAEPSRAVRLNITLPEDLVQAIDRATTNRSRFLAEAARAKLLAA